jgi:hypothetical protein
MSSSQLLTLTESHGFRALLAVVAWILGQLAQLKRGLRNLSVNGRLWSDDANRGWLRSYYAELECSPRGPVLWFDIVGRRDGPAAGVASHRHRRPILGRYCSPAFAVAKTTAHGRAHFRRT